MLCSFLHHWLLLLLPRVVMIKREWYVVFGAQLGDVWPIFGSLFAMMSKCLRILCATLQFFDMFVIGRRLRAETRLFCTSIDGGVEIKQLGPVFCIDTANHDMITARD